MSADKISAEVKQFIADHINSVEQLEILLLLSREPEKDWTVMEVSQKVYSQAGSVNIRAFSNAFKTKHGD